VDTFEDWLKYQKLDTVVEQIPADVLAGLRSHFEDTKAKMDAFRPQVFKPGTTGGHCYAVAIEDGDRLRLTLWIKRSIRAECFIMYPRDSEWAPHASYHPDGRYHQKSYGTKTSVRQHQRLDGFRGAQHLGMFAGHGISGTPICDPTRFTSVLTVPAGILEPLHGCVLVNPRERDLHGKKLREVWRALGGTDPSATTWWSDWIKCRDLRNAVAHQGAAVTTEQAERAVKMATNYVIHITVTRTT
jgi:hypothetical protein